jgi:hypothetical protein
MSNVIDEDARGPVSVQRWRRHGMDRLYVNKVDGKRIGWVDLETGARVIELPERAGLFEGAVAEWMSAHPDVGK